MEESSWQLLETVQLSVLLFHCTVQSQNIVAFMTISKIRSRNIPDYDMIK